MVIRSSLKRAWDEPAVPAGQSCWSNEYSLTLRRDITQVLPNGEKVRRIFEMSEVQVNRESDPGLFDLAGRKFTIFRGQPAAKPAIQ